MNNTMVDLPEDILKYFKETGREGGKKTAAKYGKDHYRKLAENMNKKRWANHKKKTKAA